MHCGPPNQNFGLDMAHPAYPVVPPLGLGSAVSFPSGVRGGTPTAVAFCRIALKTHLESMWTQHFWFFGQHCNKRQNESQSRLRSTLVSTVNLHYIEGLDIVVVQTCKLIFVRSEISAPLP